MKRSILLALATGAIAACASTGGSPPNASPPGASPTPSASTYELRGHVAAGPTCPVARASPLPGQCEPRPVAGAILVIIDAAGHEVARLTSAANGGFASTLPAGRYTITPQPVEGLMGLAQPVDVGVGPNASPSDIAIEYDTGIR